MRDENYSRLCFSAKHPGVGVCVHVCVIAFSVDQNTHFTKQNEDILRVCHHNFRKLKLAFKIKVRICFRAMASGVWVWVWRCVTLQSLMHEVLA